MLSAIVLEWKQQTEKVQRKQKDNVCVSKSEWRFLQISFEFIFPFTGYWILLGLCQFCSIADAAETVMSQNSTAFFRFRVFCCRWCFGLMLDLDSFVSQRFFLLDTVSAVHSITNTLLSLDLAQDSFLFLLLCCLRCARGWIPNLYSWFDRVQTNICKLDLMKTLWDSLVLRNQMCL